MTTTDTYRPLPTDAFPTPTSLTQSQTEAILLTHLPQQHQVPTLQKNSHIQFLARNLIQGFPERYISQDASQPWLLFWTLQAFSILQVGLDPGNKQRAIDKIMASQHPKGGFGGGPGQAAHLLPTYASVCALAIVGRPGPDGGWDQIDKHAMYTFFLSLKQPDGSFLVAHHGEVDMRGIYCLLVCATLLDILTPELVEGTAGFIESCQTYEGGFASSSQPYFTVDLAGKMKLLESPRPPLGEAHGGYTFCAIAAWVLLKPFLEDGEKGGRKRKEIDVKNLLRWLVNMQGGTSELGGFKGRTNKLVDGCYAWWCGGAFALLEALGLESKGANERGDNANTGVEKSSADEEWDDDDDGDVLFNRRALQEYILFAGQHPAGGLRDKPPKNADAYHTQYCLAGLSAAQHRVVPSPSRYDDIINAWKAAPNSGQHHLDVGDGDNDNDQTPIWSGRLGGEVRKRVFAAALAWSEEEGGSVFLGGTKENRVNATHPVFNLTVTHVEGMMAHFYRQVLPPRKSPIPAGMRKREDRKS